MHEVSCPSIEREKTLRLRLSHHLGVAEGYKDVPSMDPEPTENASRWFSLDHRGFP